MSEAKAVRREERAPGLRLIYAVVFLGMASAALAASYPEVLHLIDALGRAYHSGPPPRPVTLLGVVVVLAGVAGVIAAFVRRREIPLPFSLAILGGGALCIIGLVQGFPEGRSWASADKEILRVASLVHREMVDRLQVDGEVPRDASAWQAQLDTAADGQPSPARTRGFARVPYKVVTVDEPEQRPDPLVPGTLLVWVAPQGEAFELRPVGFSEAGEVAPLAHEGETLVLRGTFNPDAKAAPALPPGLPPGPDGMGGVPGGSP